MMSDAGANILIVTRDTIAGLGLRTLLAEQFGLNATYLPTPEQSSDQPVRYDEFQLIFIDEDARDVLPVRSSRKLSDRVVVMRRGNENRCLDISAPFDLLMREIESILTQRRVNRNDREAKLSRREIDVLRLLARGYITKEIADELRISFHTVISHRKNISTKLGIKTVQGLTVYATINGIVPPGPLR